METIESVDVFPTVELGGKTYEVKFTRGTLFKLDDAGIIFSPQSTKTGLTVGLAMLIKVFHMAIGFEGTYEELTELAYDKRDEIAGKLIHAWGKVVLPSIQAKISAQAAAKPSAETQTVQ